MRTLSLRARLLAGMAVVALVLIGVAVVITRTTQTYLLAQVDSQLEFAGGPQRFGGGNRADPDNQPTPVGGQQPQALSSIYVAMVNSSGGVTVLATPRLTGDDPPLPDVSVGEVADMAESGDPFTVDSDVAGERYRLRARVDPLSGDMILVGLPIKNVDDAVSRLVWVEIIATLAVLAVLSLVTWWVIRLGVRPIKRMTAAASTIAAGDLSHRVPTAAEGTEAGELGTALNQMLTRIETAFDERAESEQRLRRFIADASHELRTPVTTIRGYGELYRMGGLAETAQLDEAMRRTEQEAMRMGNLVSDMLQLARLDQGRDLRLLPVRLDQVVADAVADARAVQPEREITATLDHTVVVGDDERLRQVVANVLGNALVHTPIDARIDVDVRAVPDATSPTAPSQTAVSQTAASPTAASPTGAVLTIRDHGPGMDEDAMRQAFERFYRADPSRSRHQGGSGLGLAIVESIVAAHGGEVTMASEVGIGTTVTVTFPTVSSASTTSTDSLTAGPTPMPAARPSPPSTASEL